MSTISQLEPCPRLLSAQHLDSFARNGYLAFRDVLTPDETAGACSAITALVRGLAAMDCEHVGRMWVSPGGRFSVQFESEAPACATAEELELQVRKLTWMADEDPLLGHIARSHPNIGGILQGLLGADPILYQEMALIKPPFIGSEKPWHQDNAYFSVAPLDAVCGVWIALDDATVENGCMHVIPGHHIDALKHIHDRDCEIPLTSLPGPGGAGGDSRWRRALLCRHAAAPDSAQYFIATPSRHPEPLSFRHQPGAAARRIR